MKQHQELKIITISCGLLLAFSAFSHPYDAPLTFREHKTDDGRNIYSNIPKKCFSKGLLTCTRLHPIFANPAAVGETRTKLTKPGKANAAKSVPLSGDLSAPASAP
jgi:hypothetical protein